MNQLKTEDVFASLREMENEGPIGSHDQGDGTIERIHHERGLGRQTIRRALERLKAQDRAHIYDWTTVTKARSAVWVRGPGEDAPKPGRISKEETKRRREESKRRAEAAKKATGEASCGAIKAKTLQHIEQVRGKPQPWFAALPGAQSLAMKEAA